jgi:hypothetical protein
MSRLLVAAVVVAASLVSLLSVAGRSGAPSQAVAEA